jgi:hypothetical protein
LVLEGFFGSLGYLGVFIVIFLFNIAPALTPPTWMVLSLIYVSYPQYFSPELLALVGCIASTLGRVVLSYVGTASRRIMGAHRKRSLDVLHKMIGSRRGGGFLVSFAVALSPFPSNAYFITIGMMEYQVLQVFLGFMFGRFISYWYSISLMHVIVHSLKDLFSNEFYSIVIANIVGLAYTILVMIIDWDKLIEERRFGIIRLRLKPSDKEETH